MSIQSGGSAAGVGVWGNTRDWDEIEEGWERVERRWTEEVYGWVDRLVQFSFWVLEHFRIAYPVEWYGWHTAGDERTCPVCAPRHGETWPETDAHEAPPLHTNCRCFVAWAFTEWRFRWVAEWRLRWDTRVVSDWRQTGTVARSEWEWRQTGWS